MVGSYWVAADQSKSVKLRRAQAYVNLWLIFAVLVLSSSSLIFLLLLSEVEGEGPDYSKTLEVEGWHVIWKNSYVLNLCRRNCLLLLAHNFPVCSFAIWEVMQLPDAWDRRPNR